ncbi:thioesterase [Amycolatopsis antarctica]|uniref:Thioesterase n=2 Tax=Amycolatopsis antarctica TaxID=1854586 RepID=A0A263CXK1_9PSEU|nr:thioesterase [Amycolatopsis antarctica]
MLERVIIAYWLGRGWNFDARTSRIPDVLQVAREIKVSYHAPIVGIGEVRLHLWIEAAGRTSFTYGFAFRSADGTTLHATGHRVQVRLDPATFQPTPLSAEGVAELALFAKPGVLAGTNDREAAR